MRGTRSRIRGLLAVAAAAVFAAAGPLASAPPAAAAPVKGTSSDFSACIRGGGQADLLLLVDESSSLLGNDPGQARVSSASYFVERLAKSAAEDGLDIDIRLDVFAHSTEQIMPWTPLVPDRLESVNGSIATLAERVEGFDTDYWTALDGAQRTLKQKAQEAQGQQRCQAIVMFTDGRLDYSPRLTPEEQQAYGVEKVFAPGVQLTSQEAADRVRQAAQDDICRAGGLADQIATSGLSTFGIGLTVDPAAQQEFDLFSSIMTGTGTAGGSCGTSGGERGEFFLAQDVDSLLLVFDRITGTETPIGSEEGICQNRVCADRAHEFVLDTTTPEVRILAQADVAGLSVTVLTPSGQTAEFPFTEPGKTEKAESGGVHFDYTWETEKTLSIEFAQGAAPANAWMGLWQLAFTDPSGQSEGKQSRSNIHIRGALAPAVSEGQPLEFHAGDTVSLTPVLALRDGSGFDAATIQGTMRYSASIVDAQGAEFPVLETEDPARMGRPVEVSLADAAIGAATLRLGLEITTAAAKRPDGSPVAGTALSPVSVDLPLTIRTPAEFPVLGESIDFGTGTGAADLRGSLEVSGAGCVWVAAEDAPQIDAAPEGLGAIAVAAPGHGERGGCLDAGAGPLELSLRTEHGGNGTVNGTVPVMLAPADGSGEPIRVDVPFTANLQNPLNALNFVLVLVAAPLLGIGLPVLLLYFAKWRISRIPARPLAAALIPVRSEHGQLLRDGAPFELGPADLRGTVAIPANGARRLQIGQTALRATIGASPTGAGFVVVDSPGEATASGASPSTDRSGLRARLPLAVHNNWVVLHRDGDPADTARLLVLLGGDAPRSEREELSRQIAARAPEVLDALVRARREAGQAPPPEPVAAGSPFSGEAAPAAGSPFQQSPFQSPAGQSGPADPGGPQPPSGGRGASPWGTV